MAFSTCDAARAVKFALVAGGLGAYVTTLVEPLRAMAADPKDGFAGCDARDGSWGVTAELRDSRTGNCVVRDVDGTLDAKQIKAFARAMRAELSAKSAVTTARIAAERGAR